MSPFSAKDEQGLSDSGFQYGCCDWCGAPLDSGERFVYEMELSSWEAGEIGLPEHLSVFLGDGAPVPACKLCRASIIENYEAKRREEAEELLNNQRSAKALQFLFMVLIYAMVIFVILGS